MNDSLQGLFFFQIMIKVSIHKEDATILNVYIPNNRTIKYLQQNDRTKEENTHIQNHSWQFEHATLGK